MIITVLTGCSSNRYKVNAKGFDEVKKSYGEGEKVTIYYSMIGTDTDYRFFVDGQKYNALYDNAKGYVIEFTMPDHDVEVTVEANRNMEMLPATDKIAKITYQRMWEYSLIGETEDPEKIKEIMKAIDEVVVSNEKVDIAIDDYGDLIIIEFKDGEKKTYYYEENYYVDQATNDHYKVSSGLRKLRAVLNELVSKEN